MFIKKAFSIFLMLMFTIANPSITYAFGKKDKTKEVPLVLNEPVSIEEKLEPVSNKAINCACDVKIEHIPKQKNIYLNTVRVHSNKAVINQGNVIKIRFAQDFSSKTAKCGDKIIFVLDKDLCTEECTKLFPAGTQIIATVKCIESPQMWNKHARVFLSIGEIKLPNGVCGTICARVFSKDHTLRKTNWATFGKIFGLTSGLFGVGAGIGAAIGVAADAAGIGALAIGMPVGGGIGLILGVVTPGLHYKARAGKTIKIQLTQDLEICLNKI